MSCHPKSLPLILTKFKTQSIFVVRAFFEFFILKGTSDAPIWAAVRASSAAPGYFNDFLLDDMVHQVMSLP